ncbi:hypothetical protein D3C76_1653340 [compost metagenome]
MRFGVFKRVIQVREDDGNVFADLLQPLLRLSGILALLIQQHELLSANKFLEVID